MTGQDSNSLSALIDALHAAAENGQVVNFWLRDDDAIQPTEPLDTLLKLTEHHSIPLTLAVIPAFTDRALVNRLETMSHVKVAVHGWSHANYAQSNEKKQELGNHRPLSEVFDELRRGFEYLSGLYQSQFVPLLVPPWNRISPEVLQGLHELGFHGVSIFGAEAKTGITTINTQVDIIDWKGTRGGCSIVDLEASILSQLEMGIFSIGILSHHLVHDVAAWDFLEKFFAATSGHPAVRWCSITELLDS